MKRDLFCLLSLSFLTVGCESVKENKEADVVTNDATKFVDKEFNPEKYYTTKDSVLLASFLGDSIYVAKKDFNEVVASHPEFFTDYPNHPDITYANNLDEMFTSEVGQDDYYIFYAYFLRKLYENDNFDHQRNKIMIIYTNLNRIFRLLDGGGSGYMHQYRRSFGYTEYSIYLYYLTRKDFTVTYDISNQKSLFKQTLKQIVEDRLGNTFDILNSEKPNLKKELFELIDEIDIQITDSFYLVQAQKFYYDTYATW
ncbi:MAG TPA: hypothetical protein VLY87_05510 [Flavobacterium sp.]|nr:hypothetical protein [Flavobacterium sp.]